MNAPSQLLFLKFLKKIGSVVIGAKHVKLHLLFATLCTIVIVPLNGFAATILFKSTNIVADRWQYDYSVNNTTSTTAIGEFTIYFDKALFQNLSIVASPQGWDSIAIQPDQQLLSDGFFDALANQTGVPPGTAQGGFSVSFDFAGSGQPGSQKFDVIDIETFRILESGFTSITSTPPPPPPPPSSNVPEPSTIYLFFSALAGLVLFNRRSFTPTI